MRFEFCRNFRSFLSSAIVSLLSKENKRNDCEFRSSRQKCVNNIHIHIHRKKVLPMYQYVLPSFSLLGVDFDKILCVNFIGHGSNQFSVVSFLGTFTVVRFGGITLLFLYLNGTNTFISSNLRLQSLG